MGGCPGDWDRVAAQAGRGLLAAAQRGPSRQDVSRRECPWHLASVTFLLGLEIPLRGVWCATAFRGTEKPPPNNKSPPRLRADERRHTDAVRPLPMEDKRKRANYLILYKKSGSDL